MSRALRGVIGLAVLPLSSACDEPTASTRRPAARLFPETVIASLAQEQIAASLSGRKDRGEQEEMLRLEAQLPGFGGFYLDSVGEVIAFSKRGTPTTPELIRSVLANAYGSRREPLVREQLRFATRAEVQTVDYALSELVGIEQLISRQSKSLPVLTAVGTHIRNNRVVVYLLDTASMDRTRQHLLSLGVPGGALAFEVTGPITLSGGFNDYYRPTRGGPVIQVGPPYGGSTGDSLIYVASHGYNVVTKPPLLLAHYFMTVSHAPNARYGTNGHIGAPVYQSFWPVATAQYGTIVNNPPWTTGASCNGHTYCTYADVALGDRVAGQTYERKIGTSVTAGIDGGYGSNAINGWYAVGDAVAPELIYATGKNLHKSGYATGTTSGDLGTPCTDVIAPMSEVGGPGATLLLRCVSFVNAAAWGKGDSGGPVFGRQAPGGSYFAVGIQVAGFGSIHPSGPHKDKCSSGTGCRFLFQRWSHIESRLGLLLNPQF